MNLKQTIIEGTIQVYKNKGIKMTMDDLAVYLKMSKKTIYAVFKDKENLFIEMVDYIFDSIKEAEQAIIDNPSLSTYEKIKGILSVLPDSYRDIDMSKINLIKERLPSVYERIEYRLNIGWENTIALLEKGIEEGVIRPISIEILKMIYEASLAQFFAANNLDNSTNNYFENLNAVVDILLHGITLGDK